MFCTQCGAQNLDNSNFCRECGKQLEVSAASPRAQQSTTNIGTGQYAGFWIRFFALIIDTIITIIITIVVVLPLAFLLGMFLAGTHSARELHSAGESFGNVVGFVLPWLYYTISESSVWQATPGKKILGLKVTDEDGDRIGFAKANGRYWGKILSVIPLGVGYLMAAFTERKQGLHDKLAGTLVTKR